MSGLNYKREQVLEGGADHATSHEVGGSDLVDHDALTNFVANEHIDWTNASVNLLTSGNITGGKVRLDSEGIDFLMSLADHGKFNNYATNKGFEFYINDGLVQVLCFLLDENGANFQSCPIITTGKITFGSLDDGAITITAFVDEDDMASDSATLIPTQQSVKAYVDTLNTRSRQFAYFTAGF